MKYLKDSLKWLYSKVTDLVLQDTTEENNYDFTSYINISNEPNKIFTKSESPSVQEILNDIFIQGYYCRDEFLERKRNKGSKQLPLKSSETYFTSKLGKRKRNEESKRKKVKFDVDDEYVCKILEFKQKYKKSQKKAFIEATVPYIKRKVEPLSLKKIEGSFVQKKIQKLNQLASIENRNLTKEEIAFILENSSLLIDDSVSPIQALKIGKIVNYIKNYESQYKRSFTERYRIKIDEPLDRRGIFLDYYQEILQREKKDLKSEENKTVVFSSKIPFTEDIQENDSDFHPDIQLGTNRTDEEIYGIQSCKNTSNTHNLINKIENPSIRFSKYSFFPENYSQEKSNIQTQNFTSTELTEEPNSKKNKAIQSVNTNEAETEIPYFTRMRPSELQEFRERENKIEKLKKEISPNLLKELDSVYELIDSPMFSYLPDNVHYQDKDILYCDDDVSYGILPYEYRHLQNLPPVILKKALDPNNTDTSIPFIHLGKVTAEEEDKYFSENNIKRILKKEIERRN